MGTENDYSERLRDISRRLRKVSELTRGVVGTYSQDAREEFARPALGLYFRRKPGSDTALPGWQEWAKHAEPL
jgi:hypothetical protein